MRSNALVEALAQLARRAAFQQLRTVEQLGYIVFLSAWSVEPVRSLVRATAAFEVPRHSSRRLSRLQARSAVLRDQIASISPSWLSMGCSLIPGHIP